MAWWKISVFIGFVTAAVMRRVWRVKRQCPSSAQMDGKTVIITGANSGIGKATAYELARRNARVILACRTINSAKETAKQLEASTGNNSFVAKELNLASLRSVREFCAQILAEENTIDVLINNAGIFQCPYAKTEDGFEMQMGVNHIGHFLLTNLLLDRLKKGAPSRLVVVSSSLHKRGSINFDDIHCEKSYRKSQAYADSKLANLLFARELSVRLEGTGVDVLALHPGMVATNLSRHVLSSWKAALLYPLVVFLGLRDAQEGCQPIVYCSVAEELTGRSGIYIGKNCTESPWSPAALNDHAARKLWKLSEKLTRPSYIGY